MRKYLLRNNLKSLQIIFTFVVLTLASVFAVQAQTTTFAQTVQNGAGQDFVFTNNGTNATFNTVSGGASIFFFYSNITGLPGDLSGPQSAHLTITASTTTPAVANSGNLVQPFNQTVTMAIIRDTPAPPGIGTGARTNLLTVVITTATNPPDLVGGTGGQSASLSATTAPQNVTFTSDFLSFALTTQRNLGFTLSSVTPGVNSGAGGFLQSFTAAGTQTFASNPPPNYAPPTAAPVTIGGQVFGEGGRGLSNARVILTEADGTVHEKVTGTFGRYEFSGIEAGQTVVVSVSSRRYAYTPQVVALQDNIADMAFHPDL